MINCVKVKYSSKEFAHLDIRRIKKKSTRDKIPVRCYLCKCGSWHLTSKVHFKDTLIETLKEQIQILKKENTNYKNISKEDREGFANNKKIQELTNQLNQKTNTIKKLREDVRHLINEYLKLKNGKQS